MAQSEKSKQLEYRLYRMGYPDDFCRKIAQYMNTDWTAGRMLGYLGHMDRVSPEEIVDEMLAILSDRQRIMEKKEAEYYNGKYINMREQGLLGEEE